MGVTKNNSPGELIEYLTNTVDNSIHHKRLGMQLIQSEERTNCRTVGSIHSNGARLRITNEQASVHGE